MIGGRGGFEIEKGMNLMLADLLSYEEHFTCYSEGEQ